MTIDVKVEIPVAERVTGQYDRQNTFVRKKQVTYQKGKPEVQYASGTSPQSKPTITIGDYTMELADLLSAIDFLTKDEPKTPVWRDKFSDQREGASGNPRYG